jgi:(p)ppGpp synthetase, RelA/SpoT family
MIRQYELVERVKAYDPYADEDSLNRAYVYSMKVHGSQTRANGDPYFLHPLEVAGILTSYRLDVASIVTGLLHDTIEDTPATFDDIKRLFGEEVARLVNGVTKLSRIELNSTQSKQAENFRKLVLAMSEDIRVLLVKLADRLHNMRTLHFIREPEKRKRIATETMEIYAPLAERIGMQELKNELEDLSFKELNPMARDSILSRLALLREQGSDLIRRIIRELRSTINDSGLNADVIGREKTAFSIWQKMKKSNLSFEQMSDVMAFRVVVASVEDCYRALGVVHGAYPVIPGRFKDYISTPKPNGYRSLHTGVFGPVRQRIEVQIRTFDMHEVAEYGVAAHWRYKQSVHTTDGRQYRWLRELLEILEHAGGAEEFLEHTKMEFFGDEVFCFTPKGSLINMPVGATPVDFAYAVHSEIGDHCVGAKINGRLMPLKTRLQNGDQVEIITSKAQTPSPTWERFVVTGKARARIRRFIRLRQRDEYLELGRGILERTFSHEGVAFSDKALEEAAKSFKQASVDDLAAQVGMGNLQARAILEAVHPAVKRKRSFYEKVVPIGRGRNKPAAKQDPGGPIHGLIPGMAVHYAACCHPLPGDRIVGLVTTGKGITIHTIDCETLDLFSDQPERWIDVAWNVGEETDEAYVGRVFVILINEPGSLSNLTSVIAKSGGNITNLRIVSRSAQFFDLFVDLEVRNAKHLTEIIAALRATVAVHSVDRTRQ